MRRAMTRAVLLLVLFVSVVGGTVPASATPPGTATGTVTLTSSALTAPPRLADGNVIVTQRSTFTFTGTFAGTSVAEESAVVHPNGLITFHATETFTGQVDGRTGTVVFRVVGTILGGSAQGQFTVLRGMEELEDLRGQGTFEATGVSGTYTAQVHFDPS